MFSTCLWTPCAFWRSISFNILIYSSCFAFWNVGLFQIVLSCHVCHVIMSMLWAIRVFRVSMLATSCSIPAPTSQWCRREMHHGRPSRYNWCRWQLRSVPNKIQVSSGHSQMTGQGFYKVCIVRRCRTCSYDILIHLMPRWNIASGLVWFQCSAWQRERCGSCSIIQV